MEQQTQLVTCDCCATAHWQHGFLTHDLYSCRLSSTHHPQTCAVITKIEFMLKYMSKSSLPPKCYRLIYLVWDSCKAKPTLLQFSYYCHQKLRQVIRLQFAVRTAANLCAHNAAVGPGATEWCRHNTCYGKAARQHEHISSTWQI